MNALTGYKIADNIRKKTEGCCGGIETAEALGIEVFQYDLANVKAMYTSADRHRTILINSKLRDPMLDIVMFHEIGHDQILDHRAMARNSPLKDIQFFGEDYMINWTEHEANIIAAHLYIDEEELIDYLIGDKMDIFKTRSLLRCPLDLMLIKLQEMSRTNRISEKYYRLLQQTGLTANNKFLKDADFGEDDFYDF